MAVASLAVPEMWFYRGGDQAGRRWRDDSLAGQCGRYGRTRRDRGALSAREKGGLMFSLRRRAAVLAVVLLAAAAALASTSSGASPSLIVGGIHVGSVKDAGYNQAQHDGLVYLKKHLPGVKLLEASNVPEGPQVETV